MANAIWREKTCVQELTIVTFAYVPGYRTEDDGGCWVWVYPWLISSGSTSKGVIGMKNLMTMARQFRNDENGAAMVEYTILLGMITVAVIATIILVGNWVVGQWTTLQAALP